MRSAKRSVGVAAALLLAVAALAAARPSAAEETRVMVRAVSRDAKIMSSKVGGARITLRDADTGEVLAEGVQQGGSGDTESIMKRPWERDGTVYDTPGAAGYLATLDLAGPTVVEVTAEGPLDTPQSTYAASKTLLLLPGRHVLGEGVLLEIHGFRMRLEAPAEEARPVAGEEMEVRVLLTMA